MFVAGAAGAYDLLARVNQQGIILSFGLAAACMLILIFGIFYVMSTFYFSMDIERLLPLPLKPSTIMGAKFTVVLVYEYLTELIVVLPILITYGVKSSAGILYYIYAIIIFLTLPIIPLVIDTFINMILMRFTNIAKNKDAFRTVAGVLGLVFAIGINVVIQKMSHQAEDPEKMANMLLQGNNSLVSGASKMFPSTKPAVNSLIYSGDLRGIANILIFLVISFALLTILMYVGESLYLKGVIGISEAASKRKKLSSKEFEQGTAQKSAVWSYTIKELRCLFRTPAYFMNCVIMNFLWPIFLFIPIFAQPDTLKDLSKVKLFVQDSSNMGLIITIAFGIMIFISLANPTAATAISREGQNMFINKYLPMSYSKQIMAKVLSAAILNFVGIAIMFPIVIVILHPPIYLILMAIILGVVITFFTAFVGILIDLNFPKLQWDNEQKAVKQNANVVIMMFGGMIIGGLTVFAVIALGFKGWIAFAVLFAVYGVATIILYLVATTVGAEVYEKIVS
jgi:ABC-2 type transport system permease protein